MARIVVSRHRHQSKERVLEDRVQVRRKQQWLFSPRSFPLAGLSAAKALVISIRVGIHVCYTYSGGMEGAYGHCIGFIMIVQSCIEFGSL
jgi:hypothetical protein